MGRRTGCRLGRAGGSLIAVFLRRTLGGPQTRADRHPGHRTPKFPHAGAHAQHRAEHVIRMMEDRVESAEDQGDIGQPYSDMRQPVRKWVWHRGCRIAFQAIKNPPGCGGLLGTQIAPSHFYQNISPATSFSFDSPGA